MTPAAWFNECWYLRPDPPAWLKPLALLYAAIVRARRAAYARGWRRVTRLPVPVIVIGNLTVGGTGKTPLVCWLAERLRERGYAPGIVTRGYRGSQREARLLTAQDEAARVGDEPVLLARRSGAPVAVGRDRPAAGRLLAARGCDVVVSDDGLQHYALARDCEIVVVDGERRFGNGWLLPAGPLREPRERLCDADAVVVNGAAERTGEALAMRLDGEVAVSLDGRRRRPLAQFAGGAVHAVAGIGNPRRFFEMLRARGIEVIEHPLDDHAQPLAGDLRFADDLPVLMTEKDAVKCGALGDARHWYVPVDAVLEPASATALLAVVSARLAGAAAPAGREFRPEG